VKDNLMRSAHVVCIVFQRFEMLGNLFILMFMRYVYNTDFQLAKLRF